MLAEGRTQLDIAAELEITDRVIRKWLANPEFSAEVDRLSLMMGVAGRAERLRIAQRVVREKLKGEVPQTDKDLLEWLKFAQSETDGIKIDFAKLTAALGADDASVASGRSVGASEEPSEAVN